MVNPNAGKFVAPDGYKDIGWNRCKSVPEINDCLALGHWPAAFDNSPLLNRGTDIVFSCDECCYFHHVDMSD